MGVSNVNLTLSLSLHLSWHSVHPSSSCLRYTTCPQAAHCLPELHGSGVHRKTRVRFGVRLAASLVARHKPALFIPRTITMFFQVLPLSFRTQSQDLCVAQQWRPFLFEITQLYSIVVDSPTGGNRPRSLGALAPGLV